MKTLDKTYCYIKHIIVQNILHKNIIYRFLLFQIFIKVSVDFP